MQDKLIGFFGLMILMIGAIAYALFVEGAAGSFLNFTSIPSFLFVIAFGGLTYIKKDKYKFHKLGSVLKKDLIFRWLDGIHRWLDIIACSNSRRFKK